MTLTFSLAFSSLLNTMGLMLQTLASGSIKLGRVKCILEEGTFCNGSILPIKTQFETSEIVSIFR